MADVIQLLPENVANQIAAGEVVQRPASVVKELMENAIDAGATQVRLIVRDAGKTLIQVMDNGCGMSETDARMSFERHATSKIRDARDLFAIRTMGFRGEALASIAAVAQVEMRTRRYTDELGVRLVVEDSTVRVQEACQAPQGTSIAVKNLFYNVPARRNFLKADAVEMRHIIDEFQRIAMANTDIHFTMHQNDTEIFHLPSGNLRQRVVKIFGDAVNKKLVPVQEETDILKITGFVGKPDYHKKNRGEQFFFVNKRYIKSSYLHHAVVAAYENLIPDDHHPLYVLSLEIDPGSIDINVHPTKQEIKFDDERLVYNYLKVAVKHALGANNVTPTLDFEQEPAFQAFPSASSYQPPVSTGSGSSSRSPETFTSDSRRHEDNLRNWQLLYEGMGIPVTELVPDDESNAESFSPESSGNFSSVEVLEMDDANEQFSRVQKEPYQIHGQFIVSHIKSGFLLIDQQAASERILYERYLDALENQPIAIQKLLFPKTLELSPADAALLRDILDDVNTLGFELALFGGNSFVIHGVPADLDRQISEEVLIGNLLDQYRNNMQMELNERKRLAAALARNTSIKRGRLLTVNEMRELIDQLFACAVPFACPSGKKIFIQHDLEEVRKQFG